MPETIQAGTAFPLPAPTLADGRYVVVRAVAEGGTAQVFLGWDTWAHGWRAIKTLLPDYAARPAIRHRFEVEARTMAMLEHPSIIRVYDAGIDTTAGAQEICFMVMEYAEGGSVVDWVERFGPMPPRLAVDVTLALSTGIRAAHERGIIHRDIKPQNLLITADGQCKVTDFGIAQVLEHTRMTMTGTVMGTVGYMAPEQHESAKHTDERADIYSIGATLYTLVRGRAATHLFMADASDFEGLPPQISSIIQRASQYRREARYPSVAEMMVDLQAARDTLPAPPPSTPSLLAARAFALDGLRPPSIGTATPAPVRPADALPGNEGSLEPVPTAPSSDPRHLSQDPVPQLLLSNSRITASGRFREVKPYGSVVDDTARRRERTLLAAAGFVAVLAMALTTAWLDVQGSRLIDAAETYEVETRELLYEAILREAGMVDELDALGVDATEVRGLLEEIDRSRDDAVRHAAAGRLENLLGQVMRQAQKESASRAHIVRALDARVERLGRAVAREHAATDQVRMIRGTIPGRVATFFGR